MNKKLMTVAVASAMAAGAFAAPEAFAQSSTVQLYGRLNFIYGVYDLGGSNLGYSTATLNGTVGTAGAQSATYTGPRSGPLGATSVNGIAISGANNQLNRAAPGKADVANDSEAEIGFKGEEAVGGGNSMWFQCLTSFDLFGNRASLGTSQWCGRNSALGFKGGWGNVFMGNWDTPMKVTAGNFRPFAIGYPIGLAPMWNGSDSNVGNGGGAGAAGFSRRQKNLVTYEMPTMSGFSASAAFSAANEATAYTASSTAQKGRLWGIQATYNNGPLILGLGYERHKNFNPAGLQLGSTQATNTTTFNAALPGYNYTGGTDSGWNAGIAYTFMGSLKLSGLYTRMQWDVGQGTDASQVNWGVYGDWAIAGPHRVRLGYTNMGTTKGSAGSMAAPIVMGNIWLNGGAGNTGGSKYHFEYAYAISKRSEISLGYARMNNDSSSNFSIGTGGATTANFGETQTYYGLRVSHVF